MTDGILDLTLPASPTTHPSLDLHPLWRRHGLVCRHVHEHVDFTGRTPATVIMSNGNCRAGQGKRPETAKFWC